MQRDHGAHARPARRRHVHGALLRHVPAPAARRTPRWARHRSSRRPSPRSSAPTRSPHPASPAWFDLSRFTGARRPPVVPPQRGTGAAPTAPALLVAPASMTSQTFRGRARPADRHRGGRPRHDGPRPSRPPRTSGPAIDAAGGPQTERARRPRRGHGVRRRCAPSAPLLSRVMVAALAPFVLLALLLLFALVSTAAQARRPHVALAKLRGQTRRRRCCASRSPSRSWWWRSPSRSAWCSRSAAAHVLARGWLHAGIPVVGSTPSRLRRPRWWCVAALAASAVAALAVIREPLSSALAACGGPRPASRFSLVLRSARGRGGARGGGQPAHLRRPVEPAARAAHPDVRRAGGRRRRSGPAARCSAGLDAAYGESAAAPRPTSPPAGSRRRHDVANLMIPLLLAAAVLDLRRRDHDGLRRLAGGPGRGRGRAPRRYLARPRTPGAPAAGDPRGRPRRAATSPAAAIEHGRRRHEPQRLRRHRPAGAGRRLGPALVRPVRSPRCSGSSRPTPGTRIPFTGRRLLVASATCAALAHARRPPSLRLQYVDGRGEQHRT